MAEEMHHALTGETLLEEWKKAKKAPTVMARGAAVVDGDVAYFMNSNGAMCSYNSSDNQWSQLPKCPHEYSSLAVIRGCITAIGGIFKHEPYKSNKWSTSFCSQEETESQLLTVIQSSMEHLRTKQKINPFRLLVKHLIRKKQNVY